MPSIVQPGKSANGQKNCIFKTPYMQFCYEHLLLSVSTRTIPKYMLVLVEHLSGAQYQETERLLVK